MSSAPEQRSPSRVVGLRYRAEEGLPVVLLKGAGPLADELLQPGASRPPVVHNPSLLDALYKLPVDSTIGPELFQAVAAILAHVLAVDAVSNAPTSEPGSPHG